MARRKNTPFPKAESEDSERSRLCFLAEAVPATKSKCETLVEQLAYLHPMVKAKDTGEAVTLQKLGGCI